MDFLSFFYNRLRINESGRYHPDFPWISLCGREHNFVHCDDTPLAFTQLMSRAQLTSLFEKKRAVSGDRSTYRSSSANESRSGSSNARDSDTQTSNCGSDGPPSPSHTTDTSIISDSSSSSPSEMDKSASANADWWLVCNHAAPFLVARFEPASLCMARTSGRVYHAFGGFETLDARASRRQSATGNASECERSGSRARRRRRGSGALGARAGAERALPLGRCQRRRRRGRRRWARARRDGHRRGDARDARRARPAYTLPLARPPARTQQPALAAARCQRPELRNRPHELITNILTC